MNHPEAINKHFYLEGLSATLTGTPENFTDDGLALHYVLTLRVVLPDKRILAAKQALSTIALARATNAPAVMEYTTEQLTRTVRAALQEISQ